MPYLNVLTCIDRESIPANKRKKKREKRKKQEGERGTGNREQGAMSNEQLAGLANEVRHDC